MQYYAYYKYTHQYIYIYIYKYIHILYIYIYILIQFLFKIWPSIGKMMNQWKRVPNLQTNLSLGCWDEEVLMLCENSDFT